MRLGLAPVCFSDPQVADVMGLGCLLLSFGLERDVLTVLASSSYAVFCVACHFVLQLTVPGYCVLRGDRNALGSNGVHISYARAVCTECWSVWC